MMGGTKALGAGMLRNRVPMAQMEWAKSKFTMERSGGHHRSHDS